MAGLSVAKPTKQPTLTVAKPTAQPTLTLAKPTAQPKITIAAPTKQPVVTLAGQQKPLTYVTIPSVPRTVAPPVSVAAPIAPQVVRPPTLDLAALQAKARADAEGAVNPYYTKQLNDFLAQQAAAKKLRETQYETGVKNLEDQLAETLAANEVTKGRTALDVGQNQAEINQSADIFQTDTGTEAATGRIAQARDLAQRGLTGGLGAQEQETAQVQRNTVEGRQEQQLQTQRKAQELFKTRTFEDLARSGELAAKSTQKGKVAAKFDLDAFIQGQGFDEAEKKNSLEAGRLGAISSETQNRAKLAFNNYLANIRDPAQLLLASQTYGGAF